MEYEHEVAELGGCILEAWGWNLSSVYEGSFQWLLARHFKSIRTVRHLQDKPRKQALTNASWGAYPSLWAAIKSAEENMDLYLQMLPGQICVEGSTSMVSRALFPFVPDNSPYHAMHDLGIKERAATLSDRLMLKHLFVQGAEEGKGEGCRESAVFLET